MDDRTPRSARATRRLLFLWLPAIAWAGLIFVLSAQPNLRFVPDERLDFLIRKAGHMVIFGILALLLWRSIAGTTAWRRPWAWALALAILYAVTDEVHQGFVAGRHPSPVDVGIDATGALSPSSPSGSSGLDGPEAAHTTPSGWSGASEDVVRSDTRQQACAGTRSWARGFRSQRNRLGSGSIS